jgi:hypothetical protein
MSDAEITHALTLKEDSYEVKHELNPSTGHYTVKNKLGNKIMEFDNNLLLKPSALHSHIQQKEMALSDRINAHNTRITNAEDAIDGHTDRLTAIESQFDPLIIINGTTSGSSHDCTSVFLESNKRGFIKGKIYFETGYIEFDVYCKNVGGTVSIQSWNLEFNYITDNKTLQFEVRSTRVYVTLVNLSSSIPFRLSYDTDFVSI